jgi:hypothetical protein
MLAQHLFDKDIYILSKNIYLYGKILLKEGAVNE